MIPAVVVETGISTQETIPASLSKLTAPICKLSTDVIPVEKSWFIEPLSTVRPPYIVVVAVVVEMYTFADLSTLKYVAVDEPMMKLSIPENAFIERVADGSVVPIPTLPLEPSIVRALIDVVAVPATVVVER